jgi:putative salt-induced outer membrane protein
MKTITKTAGASVLAMVLAAPVLAQTNITGVRDVNDRIDDINEVVAEDMERAEDAARFGAPDQRQGLSGSASIGYSGKTGNNESQEFSGGVRLSYAQGNFVQTIGAAVDFAEDSTAKTKEDILAVYDANYYFDQSFYGFALARLEADGLASTADEVRRDGFLGFGPGYRVINTPDMTWRVQAGIGVSYLEDGARNSVTETGYLAGSRFYARISDSMFMTNDTDILASDSALRVNNDLGVNFRVTDAVSTRISYLTEYNDNRAIRTDNKLGVSLVFGF